MLVVIRPPGAAEGRTLAVGDDGRWEEPTGHEAEVLGSGWWALPGLVDSHAHLAADELQLAPGVPGEIRNRAFACLEGGVFLVVDNVPSASFGSRRVYASNNGGAVQQTASWSLTRRLTLTPGSHTFAVCGILSQGSGANVGGNASSGRQSSLVVTLLNR